MSDRTVTITDDDVRFVTRAKEHYRVLAEAMERGDETRSAGLMRAQEFYAERFLIRIGAEVDHA